MYYEFSTDRLDIRFSKSGDAQQIFELYLSRLAGSKYLARKPHSSIEYTQSLLNNWSNRNSADKNNRLILVITDKSNDTAFGMLTVLKAKNIFEIHFGVSNDYSGYGYATEAPTLFCKEIEYCDRNVKFKSFTDIENIGSQKVLEKSGFIKRGKIMRYYSAPQIENMKRDVFNYQRKA